MRAPRGRCRELWGALVRQLCPDSCSSPAAEPHCGGLDLAPSMTERFASENFHTVCLSVDGHSYTAELLKKGDDDWTLIRVRVGNVAAQDLNVVRLSCFDVLVTAEEHVKRLIKHRLI